MPDFDQDDPGWTADFWHQDEPPDDDQGWAWDEVSLRPWMRIAVESPFTSDYVFNLNSSIDPEIQEWPAGTVDAGQAQDGTQERAGRLP